MTSSEGNTKEYKNIIVIVVIAIIASAVIWLLPSYSNNMGRDQEMLNVITPDFRGSLEFINELRDFKAGFIYASVIAHLFNITDQAPLFALNRFLQMLSIMIVVPTIIRKMFTNINNAWIVSIIVLGAVWPIMYYHVGDSYASQAYPLILGIPILAYLYHIEWNKKSWYYLVLMWAAIAFGNAIRDYSSLGIFVCMIILSVIKCKGNWKKCIVVIAITIISYSLMTRYIPELIYLVSGVECHWRDMANSPWHEAYVGIGFEWNPFGIQFLDKPAYDYAHSVDPNVVYPSREYNAILREGFFNLVKENPKYFLSSYIRKACLCIAPIITMSIFNFIYTILFLVAFFKTIKDRLLSLYEKKPRVFSYFLIICFFCGMLPMMVAVPLWDYSKGVQGWFAATSMLVIYNFLNARNKNRDVQ